LTQELLKFYSDPNVEKVVYQFMRRYRFYQANGKLFFANLHIYIYKGRYAVQNVIVSALSDIVLTNEQEDPLYGELLHKSPETPQVSV